MNKAVQLENETSDSQQVSKNEVQDEETRSVSINFFIHRLIAYADARRSIAAFIFILLVVAVCDTLFSYLLFEPYVRLVETLSGVQPGGFAELDIGFAPEVWQALLGMVLGTLILVISIASQSIPKLIDFYMKDIRSLLYIWFLIISGGHALIIKIYGEIGLVREPSRIFNTHVLLTICSIIAFPYVFYILRYTKPTNIIDRIYKENMNKIRSLTSTRSHSLAHIPEVVEQQQYSMFESLNQLDDILEFIDFKEVKADIISDMSRTIQNYIHLKPDIHSDFFKVSPKVRTDISFKTMVGQFEEMERNQSLYELKCFRLLNNNYIKLMEEGEFDLSSMVTGELVKIGLKAIESGDENLIELVIIRFNTFFRMAFKHAIGSNEARNIYNLSFFYGQFITHLVEHKKVDQVKKSFGYLRFYGVEIAKAFPKVPSVYFDVAVIAFEMKKLLELIHHDKWDKEIQKALLNEILQVDNPPDFNKEDLDQGIQINNVVRNIQYGLALFYLNEGVDDFVEMIAKDILDDLDYLGESTFYRVLGMTEGLMRFAGPTFWEDTDRGNVNIFFTPYKDQIDGFKKLLYELVESQLRIQTTKKYQLTDTEMDLLWEMSRMTKENEVAQISLNAENFELILSELENIDGTRLEALISLRDKLNFNSENPLLVVSNSRQIAVGTKLQINGNISGQEEQSEFQAVVQSNTPNYLFVKLADSAEPAEVDKFSSLTVRFRPLRQKKIYQFQAAPQGLGTNGLLRIAHSDYIKIVEEL